MNVYVFVPQEVKETEYRKQCLGTSRNKSFCYFVEFIRDPVWMRDTRQINRPFSSSSVPKKVASLTL